MGREAGGGANQEGVDPEKKRSAVSSAERCGAMTRRMA